MKLEDTFYQDGVVTGQVGSQLVATGEKDPTEITRQDLCRGYRAVDLRSTERKVLIPGEKCRDTAEAQYGVREVIG